MATSRTDGHTAVTGKQPDPRAAAKRTALWVGAAALGIYAALLLKAVVFGL